MLYCIYNFFIEFYGKRNRNAQRNQKTKKERKEKVVFKNTVKKDGVFLCYTIYV